MTFSHRSRVVWQSFRRLPEWVQAWVALLTLVNTLWIFLLNTPTGWLAGVAALFVVGTNIPIMYIAGGMTKAMSIPHLIAWVPLEIYLLGALLGSTAMGAAEAFYAAILLIVNGVSLGFDFIDSWKWLAGDRSVP